MNTENHASLIRASILSIWLLIVIATPYENYALLPEGLRRPQGIAGVFLGTEALQGFWFDRFVLLLTKWTAATLALLLLLWPRRFRWWSVLLCGLAVVLDALTKSINGYANHAQAAPLFMLMVVACFSSLRFRSPLESSAVEKQNETYDDFIWFCRLVIVLPYTYIGLHRLFENGIAIFQDDTIIDYVRRSNERYSNFGFSMFARFVEWPWFASTLKIGFAVTTFFEIASMGAMISASFRLVWLIVMIAFHLTTLFAMNIFFWENLVLVVVLFSRTRRSPRSTPAG